MGLEFPIPRHQLPQIEVSPEEHAAARGMMDRMLQRVVDEYKTFCVQDQGVVDMRRWKPFAQREDLNIFRERSGSAEAAMLGDDAVAPAAPLARDPTSVDGLVPESTMETPIMMMTGEWPGRVENAMHAVVTTSQQELALVVIFLHDDVADCSILHTMEAPTLENPYHFLGYKYFVKRSPMAAQLVKHRNSLYLEACGTVRSHTGEELGYHIMHSVDIPEFPSLKAYNCIRASQSVAYLYRQKYDNVVEVFMTGTVDIAGLIVKPIAGKFVAETLFGITRLIDCAEAKRLTHLVRQRQGSVELLEQRSRNHECTLCRQKRKVFSATGIAECHVCGKYVCSRCRVTKKIFLSDPDGILGRFQKIRCCKTCVLVANAGYAKPNLPARIGSVKSAPSVTDSYTGGSIPSRTGRTLTGGSATSGGSLHSRHRSDSNYSDSNHSKDSFGGAGGGSFQHKNIYGGSVPDNRPTASSSDASSAYNYSTSESVYSDERGASIPHSDPEHSVPRGAAPYYGPLSPRRQQSAPAASVRYNSGSLPYLDENSDHNYYRPRHQSTPLHMRAHQPPPHHQQQQYYQHQYHPSQQQQYQQYQRAPPPPPPTMDNDLIPLHFDPKISDAGADENQSLVVAQPRPRDPNFYARGNSRSRLGSDDDYVYQQHQQPPTYMASPPPPVATSIPTPNHYGNAPQSDLFNRIIHLRQVAESTYNTTKQTAVFMAQQPSPQPQPQRQYQHQQQYQHQPPQQHYRQDGRGRYA